MGSIGAQIYSAMRGPQNLASSPQEPEYQADAVKPNTLPPLELAHQVVLPAEPPVMIPEPQQEIVLASEPEHQADGAPKPEHQDAKPREIHVQENLQLVCNS